MTPDLVKQLVAIGDADLPAERREEVLTAASAVMEQAARQSLSRPLVLVWASSRRSEGRFRPVWLLVLPCGAILVVRGVGRSRRVATCYFTKAVCRVDDPGRRWKRLVQQLVWRYAVLDRRGLLPPDEAETIAVRSRWGIGEYRTQVRFVTLDQWGFCTELDGHPWRGRLRPWPGEPPAEARRRCRLSKRWRSAEHAEENSHV